eukprot:scaffold65206_cov31-Tisochrysis_lutea.AAC.1
MDCTAARPPLPSPGLPGYRTRAVAPSRQPGAIAIGALEPRGKGREEGAGENHSLSHSAHHHPTCGNKCVQSPPPKR